jgi:hypothetical protein
LPRSLQGSGISISVFAVTAATRTLCMTVFIYEFVFSPTSAATVSLFARLILTSVSPQVFDHHVSVSSFRHLISRGLSRIFFIYLREGSASIILAMCFAHLTFRLGRCSCPGYLACAVPMGDSLVVASACFCLCLSGSTLELLPLT